MNSECVYGRVAEGRCRDKKRKHREVRGLEEKKGENKERKGEGGDRECV